MKFSNGFLTFLIGLLSLGVIIYCPVDGKLHHRNISYHPEGSEPQEANAPGGGLAYDLMSHLKKCVNEIKTILSTTFGELWGNEFQQVKTYYETIESIIDKGVTSKDVLIEIFQNIELSKDSMRQEKGPSWQEEYLELMMSIESLRLLVANALETNFNYFIADIPTPIEAEATTQKTPARNVEKYLTRNKISKQAIAIQKTTHQLLEEFKNKLNILNDGLVSSLGNGWKNKFPSLMDEVEKMNLQFNSGFTKREDFINIFLIIERIKMIIFKIKGENWSKNTPQLASVFKTSDSIMRRFFNQHDYMVIDDYTIPGDEIPINSNVVDHMKESSIKLEKAIIKAFGDDWSIKLAQMKSDYDGINLLIGSNGLNKKILTEIVNQIRLLKMHAELYEGYSKTGTLSFISKEIRDLLQIIIGALNSQYGFILTTIIQKNPSFDSSNIDGEVVKEIKSQLINIQKHLIRAFGPDWSNKLPSVRFDYEKLDKLMNKPTLNKQKMIDIFSIIEYIKLHIGEDRDENDWMSSYSPLANAIETLSALIVKTLRTQFRIMIDINYEKTSGNHGSVQVINGKKY